MNFNNSLIIREVCVNDFQDAIEKEKIYESIMNKNFGLRIELCSNLNEGGITPSYGILKLAKQYLKSKCVVMLRPRGGDFVYSDLEKNVIIEDAKIINDLGFFGVAFGALINNNGNLEIDYEFCEKIIKIIGNLECTFHMAFDFVKDQFKAIEQINKLGFKRILTRGGIKDSAFLNFKTITEYYDFTKKHNLNIIILPGGGITKDNCEEFHEKTNFYFDEIHGSKII